jgi:hypothetical protein
MKRDSAKLYYIALGIFYLGFGLVTIFYPKLVQVFQTAEGIAASTPFSDNIWRHQGLDLLSVATIVFALSSQQVSAAMLRTTAVITIMPAIAVINSCLATPYWNGLFFVPCIFCLGFTVWGFSLAAKVNK